MATNTGAVRQLHRCFDTNICRTHDLISAACRISQPKRLVLWHWLVRLSGGRAHISTVDLSPAGQDIVRAAVVFLHASLDDFLQGLAVCQRLRQGRKNYNNLDEVKGLLTKLGINYREQEPYLPSIDRMMTRRHRIVTRPRRTPRGCKAPPTDA